MSGWERFVTWTAMRRPAQERIVIWRQTWHNHLCEFCLSHCTEQGLKILCVCAQVYASKQCTKEGIGEGEGKEQDRAGHEVKK